MDRDMMERLVVRLLALAQRCDDVSIRTDLMRIANEMSDLIEDGRVGGSQQNH
jgi:hypothetical protein